MLTDGLRVVFCGSALGDVSWERRAYYANPGNRFWQTLAEVGLTPRRLAAEEYPRLVDWGIGLTDLVKTDHGQDVQIFDGHVDLDEARRLLTVKGPAMAAARAGIHQQDRGRSVPGEESRAGQAAGVHRPDRGVGPSVDLRAGATVLRH